jgi:hypothetical protein
MTLPQFTQLTDRLHDLALELALLNAAINGKAGPAPHEGFDHYGMAKDVPHQ